ncbi:BTB/POZ and MATH domain-containing protein 2 [Triticum aestivum]|uniref:BTB/POZ and MATH domain-containing protein 2 n=1 Tax=Triticum aestivum TaxID=4565 RepID=UPI001D004648|nr:BTB/POZ and MATH domain-containing protein 2-like [Triticum aestivum]
MSMSAVLSALRSAGRRQLSASTAGVRQATGSHVFRIDTYAQARRTMPKGWKMSSSTFSVGGHDWRVECYPNGDWQEHDGSISLYLNHASHSKTGDAIAEFRFCILNQVDWEEPSWTRFSGVRLFSDTTDRSWGWADFVKHENLEEEKDLYVKDDCLAVLCDVTVTAGMPTDDHAEAATPKPEAVAAAPHFDLHAELVSNNQKPDVLIEVGGETLAVHRRVLEARSPVFKADLSLASASEGATTVLRVDDMDADVCKALLWFIYSGTPDMNQLETADTMAERLLVAADRYKLEELKQICADALRRRIRMSSVGTTLALAERHSCPELREACMQYISFPGNLKALMATDGFEQMKTDCSSALLELVLKQMVRLEL